MNIEKLVSDDIFIEKILHAKNDEDIKKIFAEYGVSVTDEQITNFKNSFLQSLKENEEIESVSGGYDVSKIGYSVGQGLGYGGNTGMYLGAALGAIAGITDASIKAGKGKVDDTWGFIKEALKISIKTSFIGGATGAVLGGIAQPLDQLGKQSDELLDQY